MFCSVLFSPGRASGSYPVCWCAMCRGRAAEVWSPKGRRSTALTPGYLISSGTPSLGAVQAERHQNKCTASPCH